MTPQPRYNPGLPWNKGVNGEQVLPLINDDVPVLRVKAGPGTGKTFGLRKRVLRILHPDGLGISSRKVLVCAFNRIIAKELAREIRKELGPYNLEIPQIGTVHSICASMLGGLSRRILLPHEEEAMIYDIRGQFPAINKEFGNDQRVALKALRDHEAGIKDYPNLSQAAQQWLAEHGADIIGDLPREVERKLVNGEFADIRYDHIVVDEFQDLTESEAKIMVSLRAEGGSITGLGDQKQSIYSFRGNTRRGLEAIPGLVAEPVTDHTMNECQRCPDRIVAFSNAVMSLENEPLVGVCGKAGQLHNVHFENPNAESVGMAEEICRVYHAKPAAKHLVMVTRRQWGYALRNAIKKHEPGIEVHTMFAEDVLETWPVREAFIFLSIVSDPNDAAALRDWVAYKTPDANGVGFKAAERNSDAYLNLKAVHGTLTVEKALALAEKVEKDFKGSGRGNVLSRLQRFRDLYMSLPQTNDVAQLCNHILQENIWLNPDSTNADQEKDDFGRLKKEIDTLIVELGDRVNFKELVGKLRYRIGTRQPIGMDTESDGGIHIVTLWGAKGLTADYVYLLGLCDEALPGNWDSESSGLTEAEFLAEQRRLLYVTLTRAKESLVISRALKIKKGDVPALGLLMPRRNGWWWTDLSICRFLIHIPREILPPSVPLAHWGKVIIENELAPASVVRA